MNDALFITKKCITPFLLPPGVFVLILLISGLLLLRRKSWKIGVLNCIIALLIWLSSLTPFADMLLAKREQGLLLPEKINGDAIVVLGGGISGDARDMSGSGVLTEDSLSRIVTAARLERKLKVPVLVSGGAVFKDTKPEARIMKRYLVDLGVPEDRIIEESKSRDTLENARYTRDICTRRGYRKIVLVTSAYHMKRAVTAFRKNGVEVIPYPAYIDERRTSYSIMELLPSASAMTAVSNVVREYLGSLFYRFMS
jgi:uncharacterized SAM-binding protein YcdF (DUF218 family)